MIFFVFSYNRGPLLKNCVDSIEKCAPQAKLVVYDDNSNDPETLDILASIRTRHEVRAMGDKKSKDQHGALYTNMQRAIDSVIADELIFFIQDDAQLIRPVTESDINFMRRYFTDNPRAGFLAPVFQKRITKKRTLDRFVYDEKLGVYICQHHSRIEVAGVYYSDISITTRQRLREVNWSFISGEYQNELQAKTKFHEMGYLFAPLAMQLPNAPAYRNKKKSFAFQIAEKINKSGLYKFHLMTREQTEKLLKRPHSQVPIAEDFLETDPPLRKPWIFHPLKRSRLLRKMDKLENFLRKLYNK